MKYDKPDVTLLAPAISAIQGCSTKGRGFEDSNTGGCTGPKPSVAAYEADE